MNATSTLSVAAVRRLPWWVAAALAVTALTILYGAALRAGFLNDDHVFLEAAQSRGLVESLDEPGPLAGYYRPLSRQVYFEVMTRVGDHQPIVFHAVNYLLFLAALVLLGDLLSAFLGARGVMAGVLYFALLPFQKVNLIWVSCAQDLLALTASLGAVALYRRNRLGPAALAYLAAIASKESALPLPLALAAWDRLVIGERWKHIGRRLVRVLAAGAAWSAIALWVHARQSGGPPLGFTLDRFAAGYAHLIQSLLGLEHPAGFLTSLARHPPPALPFFLLAPLSLWYARANPIEPATRVSVRRLTWFALAWLGAFGLVVWPVSHGWSAYHYTLAAVGGALLAGLALGRGDRWVWLAIATGLLWWHAGGTSTRAFAVTERPWTWTSHVTSFYLQRASALTDTMSRQLVAIEPRPSPGTRFYFATLPPWAGFQMGNGALIRNLYRDSTLQSYFYSQFSESTAADRPCRFLFWDGARLDRLYRDARDPMFQVGGDLLLLDAPAGAAHAFRRGLAEGESPMDNLYWLGWAELWRDHRAMAEAVWTRFGAVDDSLRWIAHLRAARNALFEDADTVTAKRHLVRAIEYGIGRPEAHAVLGQLLVAEQPKYGMLELKVAAWLKPADWQARRDLVIALARARLDAPARRELEALKEIYPEWRADPNLAAIDGALNGPVREVMEL